MIDLAILREDPVAFAEALYGLKLTDAQREALRSPPTAKDFIRYEKRRRKAVDDMLYMQGKLVRRRDGPRHWRRDVPCPQFTPTPALPVARRTAPTC